MLAGFHRHSATPAGERIGTSYHKVVVKLLTIKRMLEHDGTISYDHARWAENVETYFRELWKCGNLARQSVLSDFPAAPSGHGLAITPCKVKDASRIHKRRHVLDLYGCSAESLLIVAESRPCVVASVLQLLACSEPEMESIGIHGSVKAKKPGAVPTSKVRTILPLPVVRSTGFAIVARHMTIQIDAHAATIPHAFLVCASTAKCWMLSSI